jgi:hypothetical protein
VVSSGFKHAFACATSIAALLPGCHQEVLGAPEVPQAIREQDPGPVTDKAPETASSAAPEIVDIDLTPYGLSAKIRTDGHVEAKGTPNGIVLRTDEGFELVVGRGSLDMTAEREELVRKYGKRFARFLIDSEHVVAWEIAGPTKSVYHFFASFERKALSHHCRTGPDGAPTPQLVDTMVDICRSITASKK